MINIEGRTGTSHRPGYSDADFSGDREQLHGVESEARLEGPSGQRLHCLVVFDVAAA